MMPTTLFYHILNGLYYTVLAYLAFATLYYFIFSIAGKFYREKGKHKNASNSRFLLLIPAYKEDAVIYHTAKAATEHQSKSLFDVAVIADSLQKQTLNKLQELNIRLFPVQFQKSTKVKALQYALKNTSDLYDYVIVLDADNKMKASFIDEINFRLQLGYQVVQGHRTAKNQNTSLAILDSISEEINNNIFRKGHAALGLSAAIIGSGFGCNYTLFRNILAQMTAVGGFDKELEVILLERKIKIGYARQAIVYDEKVQHSKNFSNQRRRWISAQIYYLRKYILSATGNLLIRGNIDLFNKVLQFALPPRILTLGILYLGVIIHGLAGYFTAYSVFSLLPVFWMAVLLILTVSLLLSIPKKHFTIKGLKSLSSLPKSFLIMFSILFKIKGANKQFIHTQHGIKN
jgi:cellulose synthase/poly-beta-1,6-N-acetylglucosamine synthase-like glycosyltransferase